MRGVAPHWSINMSLENPSNVYSQNLTTANVMLEVGSRVLVELLGDDATANIVDSQPVNLELATAVLAERISTYLD